MAVFGLFAVELLLLIHLLAACQLPLPFLSPPPRAHVNSTRGRIRETGAQGPDMAIERVLLLFAVHIRGLLIPGGVVEIRIVGVEAEEELGAQMPVPRPAEVYFSDNSSIYGAVGTEQGIPSRTHFLTCQETVAIFDEFVLQDVSAGLGQVAPYFLQ